MKFRADECALSNGEAGVTICYMYLCFLCVVSSSNLCFEIPERLAGVPQASTSA